MAGGRPIPVWGARTYVMGILNVTPDSFFDGGRHVTPETAGAQSKRMEEEGAEVIDIGAESSRPGAATIGLEEELRRLIPALERARAETTRLISVDTAKPAVARAALAAGADWINDIWGLQGDPEMARVAAESGAVVVAMHNSRSADYPDGVVAEIERFFERTLKTAAAAGIAADRLILDPGIGFGKTAAQSLGVMRDLPRLRQFRQPLLLGASRKSFIGAILDLPASERLEGSITATVAAIAAGFDIVRVHDVRAHVRAARIADAIFRKAETLKS